MLSHITEFLIHKGYATIDKETEGILFREDKNCVYAITLSYVDGEDDSDVYCEVQRKVEFTLATRFAKKVQCLHIVLTKDGMFEAAEQHLLEHLSNVWLIAADTGRLYIFERQPVDFDGIRNELEDVLKHCIDVYRREVAFRFTPVNSAIVILNVLAFVVITIMHGDLFATYDSNIMLRMGAMSYKTVMDGAWYQVITSFFLHFGFPHLMNNMILLAYTGCELERRVGSVTYLIMYLIFGIVGNVVSLVYYHGQGEQVVSAGASGAIYGVIGALLVLLVVRQIRSRDLSPTRIVIMVVISIYHGLASTGVDNGAHIGGLLAGIVGGFLLSKISRYGKLE